MSARIAIVTATVDGDRAQACLDSWRLNATQPLDVYAVVQGGMNREWECRVATKQGRTYVRESREILGVVPAFNLGVQRALEDGAPIIACLHDDLLIEQDGWDEDVSRLFKACPRAGLCGFGGAKGLGSDDLYQTPYQPMQLARQGFRSNMRDAEAHGIRSEVAEPVACLDGFSQIGLRDFWAGKRRDTAERRQDAFETPLLQQLQAGGVIHHFYDGMLGCFAKRLGYQVWYLPIKCHHFGGLTAVADPRYHEWANRYAQATDRLEGIAEEGTGDQVFWLRSHQIGYTHFRDVLPIRT